MALARVVALFLLSGVPAAFAGGTASPKPPPPPSVDLASLPAGATARPPQGDGKRHPVQARLLVDHASVAPGDTIRVGVLLEQDAGWHTYWRSPGDIGQPTVVTWKLPDGATARPYQFPVPQRFEEPGIATSYGYEDRSFLFAEVKLPADISGSVDLGASASWLVCQSECIPGGPVDLKASIPVGTSAPSAFAPYFDHFAKQLPTPSLRETRITAETAVCASAVRPDDELAVAVLVQPTGTTKIGAPPKEGLWPTVTPIYDSNVFLSETLVAPTPEGGLLVVVKGTGTPGDPLPDHSDLGALFQLDLDGKVVPTEITAPVQWAAKGARVEPSRSPVWETAKKLLNVECPTLAPPDAAAGPDLTGPGITATSPEVPVPPPEAAAPVSAPLMMVLAFIGGLLLNIMPCVLPVLTLKMYGLVEGGADSPTERRKAGIAYTGGILVSFWVLAGIVLALKATIGGVGWGFQFQYPGYVAVLTAIVFGFALSMFGVFEIPAIGADKAGEAASREGLAGHFLTGVFATLLGTPCSAPFLGPAIGFAFSQSAPVTAVFFTIVGLGLAFPFLLVAFLPGLFRLMPAPGDWMDTFKHLMGFSLVATTVWLYGVLESQIGPGGAGWYLGFLVVVAMAVWAFGRFGGVAETTGRQAAVAAGALVAMGIGWFFLVDLTPAAKADCDDGATQTSGLDYSQKIPYQPFTEGRLAELKDRIVFIDFTADWCLTCKVNEKTVLDTPAVRQVMGELDVVSLKADWTVRDPVITAWLERFGRAGVPMYLVIPKNGGAPIQLPEVITQSMVIDALRTAAGQGAATASQGPNVPSPNP